MAQNDKIVKYCDTGIGFCVTFAAFFIPISNALIEIFLTLAISLWAVKKIISKTRLNDIFYPTFIRTPIFIYLFACLLSAIVSTNRGISFTHLFLKTGEYLLFFFIVVETINKKVLRNILIALIFSSALVGIDGIIQYFTKHDFLRNRPMPIFEVQQRISGPFKIPNDFGNYVATILPLTASFCFLNFRRIWIKFILMVISLILFIALFLSVTKSAWLGFILAGFFLAVIGNRKLFIVMLLSMVIILCFLPLFSYVAQTRVLHFFEFREGAGITQRDFLWKIGLDMFAERPVLGQGLGTFMYNFEKFQPKDYTQGWGIAYAHNCFLQIASETGILGFLTFILIITLLLFVGIKILLKRRQDYQYYCLSGLLAGLFAYLAGSFFDTNLYSLPLTVLFWLIMGLACGVIKIIKSETS